ncbi:MAG TPA: hypothetical protein PKY77_11665 [Phycisphaerae bacterium]|nr:hypothetical protein [Phycisphaerae bacterium]HRY70531.1 hypothetical protein [Phycisphaerae bacterium]HSA27979.1 hypothetical protein [Phycisphaerae bacterium]
MLAPPDPVYSRHRVSWVFALAAASLLACLTWMVKVDYDRPWRGWQQQYIATQAALARSDVQAAQSDEVRKALADAEEAVRLAQTRPASDPAAAFDLAQAQRRVEHLTRQREDALQRARIWLERDGGGVLSAPFLDFLAPRGTPGKCEVRQVILPEVYQNLHFVRTTQTDRCMTCHVAVANRHFAERGSTRRPSANVAQPLLAHPNLDLYAVADSPHPMARMGCTICHEGNGEETDFVLAGHRPRSEAQRREWERKYYVRRAGLVPEHTFDSAAARWERPILKTEYTEANCAQCHTRVADIAVHDGEPAAVRINEGRYLFTTLGCVNCHLVEELADARKVAIDLSQVGDKVSRGWLHQWIWQPREQRPSSNMPHTFLQENNDALSDRGGGDIDPILRTQAEAVAIAEYLLNTGQTSRRQSLPGALWSTLQDEQSEAVAAAADRGRRLFGAIGCLACHAALQHRPDSDLGVPGEPLGVTWVAERLAATRPADADEDGVYRDAEAMNVTRQAAFMTAHLATEADAIFRPHAAGEPVLARRGPELSGLRAKFTGYRPAVEWLYDWLTEPRRYSSDTIMPVLRLARGLKPVIDRRTGHKTKSQVDADEALDISIYLATLPGDLGSGSEPFDARAEDAHQLAATRDELLRRLGGSIDPQAPRPGADLEHQRWVALGERMIGHYGCFGCHRIPGFENTPRIGPEFTEWGEVPLNRLDFGHLDPVANRDRPVGERFRLLYPPDRESLLRLVPSNPEQRVEYSRESFAWHKMRNPRLWDRDRTCGPYDKLRMPNFFLFDRQAESLVTWLLSRKPSRAGELLKVAYDDRPAGWVADGRNLVRELNCVGCHRIDGNRALLDQYSKAIEGPNVVFDEENAPPTLNGEGAKVLPAWSQSYLRQVVTMRPWLKARMPQYHLSDGETTRLAAYFAGLSRQESRWLDRQAAAGISEPLRRFAARNRWLPAHLLDPRQVPPPVHAAALREVLADATFLGRLNDVSYPFAESPVSATSSPDRLADGETIFFELKCLKCHVFGDPSAAGANVKPTAPNLDLTPSRLRRSWSIAWMQAPGRIQPGTKMPALFGVGATSAFAAYPPDQRDRVQSLLRDKSLVNDGSRQIEAVNDFVYDAALRRLNKVQPGGLEDEKPKVGTPNADQGETTDL